MINYRDFLSILDCGVMLSVRRNLEKYMQNIPLGNREMYQIAKMTEEVGECLQALYAEKFAPPTWGHYSQVRGTFESEAADVIIAALGVIGLTGKKPQLLIYKDSAVNVELFSRELISAVEYSSPARAISAVFTFCKEEGIDIMRHVQARVAFNEELLRGVK
jgi:hypothetical protein